MKKGILIILVSVAATVFTSCRETDVPAPSFDGPKERTLLIYMAAQNSLGRGVYAYDYQNINSLLAGIDKNHLRANNIVIYHDPYATVDGRTDALPQLLKVEMGSDGKAFARPIEVYDEQNSASARVMERVVDRVLTDPLFKAENYGFLMWSHGTGWLPANPAYTPMGRAIGQDVGDSRTEDHWMNIEDFVAAIPDGAFDYIAVDACYMASAEFAYALREKTDYLIAAPTEIMGTGMPYHLLADHLLGAEPDYEGFCDAFFDYYDNAYGSTISLIRASAMGPVAAVVKDILDGVTMDEIHALPIATMQHFDRTGSSHPYHLFFDLGDYMQRIATPAQLADFERVLASAAPYERHSDGFMADFDGFPIERYSGMSVYVPQDHAGLDRVNAYYRTLEWYRAVYAE